jgi:hypothetical protein
VGSKGLLKSFSVTASDIRVEKGQEFRQLTVSGKALTNLVV